jgi:hypothetical protein
VPTLLLYAQDSGSSLDTNFELDTAKLSNDSGFVLDTNFELDAAQLDGGPSRDIWLRVQPADVTLAITGVSGSVSGGSIGKTFTIVLPDQNISASSGTLTPSTTKAVSGESVASSLESIVQSSGVVLTSDALSGNIGDMAYSSVFALLGSLATASTGSIVFIEGTISQNRIRATRWPGPPGAKSINQENK